MRFIKLTFSVFSCAALVACGTTIPDNLPPPEPEVVIETAPVIVATGCIGESGRPSVPRSLKNIYSPDQWLSMPTGAKAQAVKAQAGERLNYEDALAAVTAGCE